MNPLFSAGWPRPGQWVVLDVNGQKRPGINNPSSFIERLKFGQDPQDPTVSWMADPENVRVDLVELEGAQAGLKTMASLIVNVMELAPLLDKSKIPAPRLRTMDPKWEPVP